MADAKPRGYQASFSAGYPEMFAFAGRQRKAATVVAILDNELGSRLAVSRVVNVGCSTGIMDSFIAPKVGSLIGIDIDEAAVAYANHTHRLPNISFRVGDAMDIDIPDASCDVVICSQVYEHVPDATRMMREILRILVPGGLCYFAATNRLCIVEQHYFLPFLSYLPAPMANAYLRILGRGKVYYERHFTLPTLKRLVSGFESTDYTIRVVEEPEKFATTYLVGDKAVVRRLYLMLGRFAYWALPGYLWVLRKPTSP